MQSPPQLARYRLRGRLLLALCPLLAAIAYLVFAIQAASWSVSLNDSNATWEALRFNEKRFFRLDYDTATVNEVSEFEQQSVQKNSKGELILSRYRRNGNEPRSNLVLEVLDPRNRTVIRSIEFPNHPKIIGGRFAVAASKGTLYCADLDADELELKTLSVNSSVDTIADAERDRLIWTIVRQPNSSVNSLEIYEVTDDANINLVNSFPIFDEAVAVEHGVIKLLTGDCTSFEVRDLTTGKLISSTPVPPEYVAGVSSIALRSGYLAIQFGRDYRLFNPVLNVELEQQLPGNLCAFDPNEKWERLAVAHPDAMNRASIDVFDLANGKVIFTQRTILPTADSIGLKIANRDTLMIQHAQNGLTIDLFDIPSGKLVRRIAPYGWGTWALQMLFAALAIWVAAWLRASAYEHGWAWIDVCLLTAIALTPLIVRLLYIHMPGDVSRLPINFSQGIIGGLANVCTLWMAMGRTRFTLRMLPLLGTMALLNGLLVLLFAPTWYESQSILLNQAMNGLCSTVGTVTGIYVVYFFLHWFGWSVHNVNDEGMERPSIGRGVPIRDYFLLTAVLAILVTVSRGLLPAFAELFQFRIYFPVFLISVACFISIALLTLSKSRIAVFVSQVIALIMFLIVVGYPMAEFNLGISRLLLITQPQEILRVIAAGLLSTFVYLQAYRLRGWRLGWRKGEDKDYIAPVTLMGLN